MKAKTLKFLPDNQTTALRFPRYRSKHLCRQERLPQNLVANFKQPRIVIVSFIMRIDGRERNKAGGFVRFQYENQTTFGLIDSITMYAIDLNACGSYTSRELAN